MGPEDLMIGDWILNNGKPMQIESGDDISWLEHIYQETVVGHFEEIFKPIPITPEILKKNGLHHYLLPSDGVHSKSEWYSWRINGTYIEMQTYNGTKWETQIQSEKHSGRYGGEIKRYEGSITSVHELQHALRLCEIDKEIIP